MGIKDYFNIDKAFPFYFAYHRDPTNILIHIVGVPSIAITTLYFLSHLTLGAMLSSIFPVGPQVGAVSVADILITFYAISFLFMEPVAALLYMPVLYGMRHLGCVTLQGHRDLAIAIHVVAWISQFVGHGVFEGRKPALLDSFFQSVHAAVFFVWMELLFFVGYRPELKARMEELVVPYLPKEEQSKVLKKSSSGKKKK